jgi:ParB family transcriptional regulator, chromosome partitioning protein
MSRRSGLGRGLAALIPPAVPGESETDAPSAEEVPASRTDPDAAAPGPSDTAPPAGLVTTDPSDLAGAVDARDVATSTAGTAPNTGTEPAVAAPSLEPQHVDDDARDDAHGAPREEPARDRTTPDASTAAAPAATVDAARPEAVPAVSVDAAPIGQVPSAAATLEEVAPSSIVPNPRQPREVFDPDELANLATSLTDIGVLQPLVVRPLEDGRYELIAGERRLRAATLAGLSTVPVVVRHTDDADLLKEALVENIHRVQLNPLEEGAAYQQLLEDFGVTQEELASRLGRSRPAISNAIRLLQLPAGVQRRVASGVLSAGHAKVLLAIEDPDQQVRLADRIVAEGMSVRATEELVRLRLLDGHGVPAASRRRNPTAPGIIELQDDLSDALEARVKISMGAKKGKLAIDFASVDDLERIVSVIANGLEGSRTVLPPASSGGAAPAPSPSSGSGIATPDA